MLTFSEKAVTVTIWILAAAGFFFGGRAVWRRKQKRPAEQRETSRQD